jgi:glutathione S-transferase
MITLYQPPAVWGLPSMSPFCVKLETYLRMTGVEYKTSPANFLKAPNGRIPYVKIDGSYLGDTTLIIERLKKEYGDSLDSKLTPSQKAQGLLLRRFFEEHLYFGGAFLRWSNEDSWKHVRDVLKPLMPPVVGGMVLRKVRKDFLRELKTQGLAEHPTEQIVSIINEDLSALSTLLGNQPFFLGNDPSSIDATAYGFLMQQMYVPWDSPNKRHALSLPNFSAYCERMKARYWA